jgi:hypothetical protein
MFIIWGTRTFQKIMGNTVMYTCGHCGNSNHFQIIRAGDWFTLFFIPIFPFYYRYLILCPICGDGSKVKKNEALMAAAEGMGAVIHGPPPTNYLQ